MKLIIGLIFLVIIIIIVTVSRENYSLDKISLGTNWEISGNSSVLNFSGTSDKTVNFNNSVNVNGVVKQNGVALVPTGIIVSWYGTPETVPTGWALCDGTNGTPDLRGRFVLGVNKDLGNVNGTSINGGSTNINTEARVGNTIAGTVLTTGGEVLHELTEKEIPSHTHSYYIPGGAQNSYQNVGSQPFATSAYQGTSGSTGENSPHNNLPPFMVLAYIMKL